MTDPASSRGRALWRVAWLLAVALALGAGVAPAAAQATAVPLTERELEYQAARQAHEAAVAARQVVENQWRTALDSVMAARESGDQTRLDQASAAFLIQATEFERLDTRVRTTLDSLTNAREAFLDALDQRVAILVDQAESAVGDTQREGFLAVARDLQNQYREVVSESADALAPTPVFYRGILAYNPRDTPDLIRGKAQLVERRIASVQLQLAEARDRIQGLERLIRLRRAQQNFTAPLDRFGDAQVPVVSGGSNPNQDAGGLPDSASARPPTLDEQLEAWRLQERQLSLLLEQLQDNLRRFRARIGALPDAQGVLP